MGYSLIAADHPGARYTKHPPQSAFENVLLRRFPSLERLTFVQIGANDGQRIDPIAGFIASYEWRGVMLEPIPAYFEALAARYRNNPDIRLLPAALDLLPGRRSIYRLDPTLSGLPDWTHGLASFDPVRVQTVARELALSSSVVVCDQINAVAWSEVWNALGHHSCDILVVDTEGYDLTLLRAADLAVCRPSVIHFEHACVARAERLQFYGELLALGYEIATEGPDTTAWRHA